MTGPSVKRLGSAEPTLRDPALNLLTSIFGGAGATTPQTFRQPTQRPNQPFPWARNFLGQPTAMERTAALQGGTAQQNLQNVLGFGFPPELAAAFAPFLNQNAANAPGADVLSAANPIFQRNLSEALARQREVGPRFASAGQREARTLEQQGLQDFNLFAQQVLEQGRNRQLQGILGYAQANQGQQALQMQALQQLIQALFAGGLSQGIAVGPSPLGQIAGVAGAVGGAAGALGWQPFKRG